MAAPFRAIPVLRVVHREKGMDRHAGGGPPRGAGGPGGPDREDATPDGCDRLHPPALATFRFGDGTAEVATVIAADAWAPRIETAFQRMALLRSLQLQGYEVLHASAVLTERGVVPFCGVSGTGKSTTAAGLSLRGHPLWADDAVGLDISDDRPRALPLPFHLRLDPAAAAFLGHGPKPSGHETPAVEPAPVAAICVLRRVAGLGAVQVTPLAPPRAFTAVLTHAHDFNLTDRARRRRLVSHYLALTSLTPVFDICFGGGLDQVPALLDRIEDLFGRL